MSMTFTNATADFMLRYNPKSIVKTKINLFQKYFGVVEVSALIGCALLAYFANYTAAEYVVYALTILSGTMLCFSLLIYYVYKNIHQLSISQYKEAIIASSAFYWNLYFVEQQRYQQKYYQYEKYIIVAVLTVCGFIIPAIIYGVAIYFHSLNVQQSKNHAAIVQDEVAIEDARFNRARDITPIN